MWDTNLIVEVLNALFGSTGKAVHFPVDRFYTRLYVSVIVIRVRSSEILKWHIHINLLNNEQRIICMQ